MARNGPFWGRFGASPAACGWRENLLLSSIAEPLNFFCAACFGQPGQARWAQRDRTAGWMSVVVHEARAERHASLVVYMEAHGWQLDDAWWTVGDKHS